MHALRGLVGLAVATSLTAQVYTTDAGVASPELPSVAQRFEFVQRDRGHEVVAETKIAVSPARWLETDLRVPWIERRGRFQSGGTMLRSEQAGLGDVALDAKVALFRDDDVMYSDRLSLLGTLTLPTGEHHDEVDGVRVPRREQLGHGGVGGALGIGATIVRDRHRAAAALRYWHEAEHGNFDPGDAVTLDLAWWYRLSPAKFEGTAASAEWRLTVEVLSRWRDDDAEGGLDSRNGGGDVAAALGLQCNVVPAVRLECAVRAPLVTESESPFGDERLGVTIAARIFF